MSISITAILAVIFLIMLAVLGHSVWHAGMVGVFNFIVQIFTGGHVTG